MFRYHENYYHRICYFNREQVPTQTVMKDRMKLPLAHVYFKSMTPKLKVIAGLEPPMKGGGTDWYIPPKDLLEDGRVVMKPVKKEHLIKLGFNGIDFFGEKLVYDHHLAMAEEKRLALLENDLNWKSSIKVGCQQQWEDTSKEQAVVNTNRILNAFNEFTNLYSTSITKIETLLFDAAIKEIKRVRATAYKKMMDHYETLLHQQATMLYDRYTERLRKKKIKMKADFIEEVEDSRMLMGYKLHDINVEKHVAIEKLRHLLECQNLACQIYVALKEREECTKEMELSRHIHKKKIKVVTETIAMKDFEIRLELEQELKRQEFNRIWQKKICHVVKKFQIFVEYCLNTLPEHAEFFINMEKLMMLQLNEASENSSAESIFVPEGPEFHTPVARPHPFFVFCDKGYKPQFDQNLCPKHCTSSASQLPVVVVNKRFIYAACDNFEKYTDKVSQFIHGQRGENTDFEDDHDYTHDIPVKYYRSEALMELKLESSLMQVLQKELPNLRDVSIDCCACKIPYCFCGDVTINTMSPHKEQETTKVKETLKVPSLESISSGNKIDTRSTELQLEREPKWESYLAFVESKKCKCAKTAKKHLYEHMPAYMMNMSVFDAPDLPNYEPCSLATLKRLVKKARGKPPPPPPPVQVESKTRDVATEISDNKFDYLCTCFSEEEITNLLKEFLKGSKMFDMKKTATKCEIVDGGISATHLGKSVSTFATERAYSLRNLLDDAPQLQEIFKKEDCKF